MLKSEPNMVVTYPPELLPTPDECDEVEVIVRDDNGERVLFRRAPLSPPHEGSRLLLRRNRLRQFVDR